MPTSYRICEDHVRVEIVGEQTLEELQSLVRVLASDQEVLGSPYLLVNVERAEPTFRTDELGLVAALHEPLLRHGLRAVLLVASPSHIFGIARGYAIQSESRRLPVHIFRSEAEAMAWLAHDAGCRQS